MIVVLWIRKNLSDITQILSNSQFTFNLLTYALRPIIHNAKEECGVCASTSSINWWLLICLSPLHQRLEWKGSVAGMTKCSVHAGMLANFPLSVHLVPWIHLLMCTVPHVAPSSPTQNWSNFFCFFLWKWQETPLQCECLTLQCTLCLCDWVLPHHHIICTLRRTLLQSLVCNSCATLTVSCSILYTL